MIRPLLCGLLASGLAAAEVGTDPLPPLPPRPAPPQVETTPGTTRATDPHAIGDDLVQLLEAVQRVEAALDQGAPATGRATASDAAGGGVRATDITIRRSSRFDLSVTRASESETTVTGQITGQRLEAVYRELATLLERPVDDADLTITQRLVTLQVRDLPWDECLDRLFGQAGIIWFIEGQGPSSRIILRERAAAGDAEVLAAMRADRARRALMRAAAGTAKPLAAEALYRLAEQEADAGRHLDAIRGFSRLVADFDDDRDPAVTPWVLQGIRGIADAMADAGQPQEALGVYRSYIARADRGDPELPMVYLAASRAALILAARSGEASAREEASLLLGGLIERFSERSDAAAAVAEARLSLGELLIAGKRWLEAEAHLAAHVRATRHEEDRIAAWRAECLFHLGRFDDAYPRFERVTAATTLSDEVRSRAAVRMGECLLGKRPPQYARALFAFLRARQNWPRLRMDGEVMVAVARCYAELEYDDGAIDEFWKLLRGNALDDQGARDALGQFLGQIQGSLASYDSTVRARVLYHIAEADHRQAWRDRTRRSQLVADAIQRYDRVLKENPEPALRNAARLGLARVAFLGGEDALGRQALAEILNDDLASQRDRQLAAQVLGDHHRDQGRLREAITAYGGKVP